MQRELNERRYKLLKEQKERSFHTFLSSTWPGFTDGWFYQDLSAVLQQFALDVQEKRSPRLILSVPPRHGKSESVSVRFALWFMLRNARGEIMTASYSQASSNRFSSRARDLVSHPWVVSKFSGVRLRADSKSVQEWQLNNGSSYKSLGVGGPATGSGADCLVADTVIVTREGLKRIDQVCVGDEVLSYNHTTNLLEFDAVIATRELVKNETCTLRTNDGGRIEGTGDHRVFDGKSYRELSRYKPGETLFTCDCVSQVQPLQQDLYFSEIRSKEENSTLYKELLFCGMWSSFKYCYEALRSLRISDRQEDISLLQTLQKWASLKKVTKKSMSYLLKRVSTTILFNSLLLKGMCQQVTQQENAKSWQSTFCRGARVSSALCKTEPYYFGARWKRVLCMWWERNAFCASHRQRQAPQPSIELDNNVQVMSYNLAQIKDRSVSSVERNCSTGIKVYDIQTKKNHNFFANGILAHNCLLIDDPTKNAEEADSPVIQQRIADWFDSVASTRLSPGGGVIIIMTRWHLKDLVGHVLSKEDAAQWKVISYPALAEQQEKHRAPGDALHPIRFNTDKLLAIKKALHPRWWSALYMQNPQQKGGNIFKEDSFQWYDYAPEFDEMIQAWDLKFSKKEDSGSYVVGQVWGRKGAHYYLVDQIRDRMGFSDSCAAVRELSARYPDAVLKLVENKANGPALEDILQAEIPGLILKEPRGDKIQRAEFVEPAFRSGNVFLPRKELWVHEYVAELTAFPRALNDDQVDATTMALGHLLTNGSDVFQVLGI